MSTQHLGQKHVGMIERELEVAVFDRDTVYRRYYVHAKAIASQNTRRVQSRLVRLLSSMRAIVTG